MMIERITTFLKKENNFYNLILLIINPIFFASMPTIWLIVFMKEKMFFSYDFFTNGMFGLSVFFFISMMLLAFLGFMMVGYLGFLSYSITKRFYSNKNKEQSSTLKDTVIENLFEIILVFINILFTWIIYSKLKTSVDYEIFIFIIIFCSSSLIHIGVSLAGNGKIKFLSLFIFSFIFMYCIIFYSRAISSVIETGLYAFQVGGNLKVNIFNHADDSTITNGSLLLLTPNKIFLRDENKTKVLNRNNIIIEIVDKIKK